MSMWWMLASLGWAQDEVRSDVLIAVPENFNAQRFRPSIDAGSMLWTDDATRARSNQFTTRVLFSYANDPLVFTYADDPVIQDIDGLDKEIEVISDILQMDVLAGYTLGPVRVGVDLPIFLLSDGEELEPESGFGDIAGDVKVSILEQDRSGFNLGVGGRVALDTATTAAPLGAGGTSWEAQVIAERSFGAGQLAINLGNQGVPSQDLEAYTWDDQFFFRAGGAYTLTDTVGTSLELAGNVPYSGAGESGSIPVEGLLGGWLRPGARDVVVRAGVGTGITGGVGAPRIRGILAVAYEPPTGADVDDDGIVDMLDNCPTRPEDVDGDRDRDGCPEPTAVTFRFIDAVTGQRVSDVAYRIDERPHTPDESVVQVSTGSHELVAEAPNYKVSRMDLVIPGGPRQTVTVTMDALSPATVAFRVQDMDGRPLKDVTWEVDAVEQGTLDVAGIRLRLSPITYRFAAVAPGYLKRSRIVQLQPGDVLRLDIQLKATTIEVSEERIELNQKIAFEGRKETFEEASIPLLDDLATVLQEYPEIRRLRIEGHTDSRGDASANLDLSEKRAQAVMEYLISRGIEPTRLRTEGLGESRPLDTRASLLAYERNRRIELIVEEWTPQVTRTVTSPDSPLIRPATEQ